MPHESKHLYFVAILPPEDIAGEVRAFQERMAEKYNAKAALKSPVHITLFPPIQLTEVSEHAFIRILDDVAGHHHPFEIKLDGFGAFPRRVIYVKPEKELRMNRLSREIVDNFIHHLVPLMELRGFRFNAHMTIAYRDLDPTMFVAAWSEFKEKAYNRSFLVSEICLLQHDSTKWNIIHRSPLAHKKSEEATDDLSLFSP